MQVGMVGLGRMGANLVRRLMASGHECVVFDLNPAAVEELSQRRSRRGSKSIEELVSLARYSRESSGS